MSTSTADGPSGEPAAIEDVTTFDLSRIAPADAYKLLIGTVVPRPIAWVTTVDAAGTVNGAPYSFFNCLSFDPPLVALGIDSLPNHRLKDTGENIRRTEEFTINIVSDALAERMCITAIPFPSGVDELKKARLTAVPGTHVATPRIGEAPVALECRRYAGVAVGRREIVLGTVLAIHIRADIVDAETFRIDPERLDAIGRLGGSGYARTRERFNMPTPTLAAWDAGTRPMRSKSGKRRPASDALLPENDT
jgi:flavin reductase (DIM6/NTAB) family NADH-FMN oxidoreductase RutF